MVEQTKKTRKKIQIKTLKLRDSLWPDAESRIWKWQNKAGWVNVPRTMPLIMRIQDSLSKGKPVSSTYLDLWCRTYDNGFLTVHTDEMAFSSGFSGERARRTWLSRIRSLRELGFIDTKEGPNGPVNYILIEDPYAVVKKLRYKKMINEQFWNSLVAKVIQIGANDLDDCLAEKPDKGK